MQNCWVSGAESSGAEGPNCYVREVGGQRNKLSEPRVRLGCVPNGVVENVQKESTGLRIFST